ncbi:MAG: hypothetical protein JSS84_04615 [Bacteroidetes bacterium]|nr:hypothetical protein [Bacteroidota bacterium]
MAPRKFVLLTLGAMVAGIAACRKDQALSPDTLPGAGSGSPVVLNLDSVPYAKLSDYHFFEGSMADMRPVQGVLPYTVITPSFGDYASKFRFVWMPAGRQARYVADHKALDFPDGTVLMKSPYYPHVLPENRRRLLDTRLMIKKDGAWIFAEYVWNAEQTEAFLNMNGVNVPLTWADDAGQAHEEVFHIPSLGECQACHMDHDQRTPIGAKPQNLNTTANYAEGPMDQLAKWVAQGYLESGYPAHIETVAKWDDPAEPADRRVRAYLDMNCAHCHYDGGFCSYRPMRFAWHETTNPVNLGICVPPQDPFTPGVNYIVHAGNANRSMLYYRLSSTDEAVRMPLLERTVRHEEAIALVRDWINAMPDTCQ